MRANERASISLRSYARRTWPVRVWGSAAGGGVIDGVQRHPEDLRSLGSGDEHERDGSADGGWATAVIHKEAQRSLMPEDRGDNVGAFSASITP